MVVAHGVPVQGGAVDVSVILRVIDSADGTPEPGVDHATAGIDLKYWREGATPVDLTEAAVATLDAAHTDGGVEQIGFGNIRVDLPDAAVATGVKGVLVFGTATGMVVIPSYIPIVSYDPHVSGASLGDIADAVCDEVVEGTLTLRQITRVVLAAVAGKLSGAATATVAIRDVADSKDRISATVDADGNRTAITLDGA